MSLTTTQHPFITSVEHWEGPLGDTELRHLHLHLDKATLYDGNVRGVASLGAQGGHTLMSVSGSASGDQLTLQISPPQAGAAYRLEATRVGVELVGTLHEEAGGASYPFALQRAVARPSAANDRPDDVPVNVSYDVETDHGSYTMGDFTMIPWVIGSWRGRELEGTGTGLVHWSFSVLDLVNDVVVFRLTTWNPLWEVGFLYIRRSQLGNEKTADLVEGSKLWIDGAWVKVGGHVTQHTKK